MATLTTSRTIIRGVATAHATTRRIIRIIDGAVKPVSEPCCPVAPGNAAFKSVHVDYLTVGGTRVTWTLVDNFADVAPYRVELQVSHSGVSDADDWVTCVAPADDPAYLIDDTQRLFGQDESIYYRVVLTTGEGTYVSAPAGLGNLPSVHDQLLSAEIARKERLRLFSFAGTPGVLLKARRYGVRCSCFNPVSRERQDSRHALCYGTGFVDGYHPPIPCFFADVPPSESRIYTDYAGGRGTVGDQLMRVRILAGPLLTQEDVWVDTASDARYFVHEVRDEVLHRGRVIIQVVSLRQAPRSSIVYTVPINAALAAGSGSCGALEPEVICLPP